MPNVEHRSSHYLNNGLERDHQHLKRVYATDARFQADGASRHVLSDHALLRNLQGSSDLTAGVSSRLRLAAAWTLLTAAL